MEQETQVGQVEGQEQEIKGTESKRAPRRVAKLVIGQWKPLNPEEGAVFIPSKLQPTGKAQREIEALKVWLRQPATAKALLEENLASVRAIREELLEASFTAIQVTKTSVK